MYKIAICGKANSGKNTLSRMIIKNIRSQNKWASAKQIAFADPIKEMIRIMFPTLPKKFLYGSSQYRKEIVPGAFDKQGKPLTVRQLLIDLGTEVGRKYKDSVWLENFDHRFEEHKYNKIVIVTDVRFRNEFEHLRDKGFFQIRLYRPSSDPPINHVSETDQNTILDSEFDYVLHNDKSLASLKEEVLTKIMPQLRDE